MSSTVDAEWDEQEQGWMLALGQYEETLCPNCRGDLTQTSKPENEYRYAAELPLTCHRCVAFAASHDTYADHRDSRALLHRVSPLPTR